MKVTQLCPALCDPLDYTVHGISQTAIVEWAAVSYSSPFLLVKESEVSQSCLTLCDPMDCSLPGYSVCGIFQARLLESEGEREVAQSCPTLSDPMDCSLTGSSVHGIFQARVLEWGAIAFSKNKE